MSDEGNQKTGASSGRKKVKVDVGKLFDVATDRPFHMTAYREPHPEAPTYLMDPEHVFDKSVLKWILYSLVESRPLQLVGVVGAGKSSTVMQTLLRLNWPLTFVSCHNGMEESDLFGHYVAGPDGMQWADGPITKAAREGLTVIVEERDKLDPSCNVALNNVLDGWPIVLPERGHEIVRPAKGFHLFATANTAGEGGEQDKFPTSLRQDASANSRWLTCRVGFLPKDEEKRVLQAKAPGMAEDYLDALIDYASSLREAAEKGDVEVPPSTRELVEIVKAGVSFDDIEEPLKVGYLNKLTPLDREAAERLYQRHFGVGVEQGAADDQD